LVRNSIINSDAVSTTKKPRINNTNLKPGSVRGPYTKCKACTYIVESDSVRSSHNDRTYKLHNKFNCASTNIVYLVTCTKCNKQYVGETGRSLRDRITDHVSCIKLRKKTPIGLHFSQAGHSLQNFTIIAIEQFGKNSDAQRHTKEITWQNILQIVHPIGINNLKHYMLS